MNGGFLTREVAKPNPSMFAKLITGAFVVGLLASPFMAPRTRRMCGLSGGRIDDARLTVQRLAYEAFPQWQRTYGGCPHSVYELTEFIEGVKSLDPWGNRYELFCQDGKVIVVSTDEDAMPNTSDDLRSNDR